MKRRVDIWAGSLFFLFLLTAGNQTFGETSNTAQSATCSSVSGCAYQLIAKRVTANRSNFFVYQDFDSGMNKGNPSGWFGNTGKIHLDAECVYDSNAANGCSTSLSRLDTSRDTVIRISFDPMSPGEWAGINFDEPGNNGYDLRGATEVDFDIMTPIPGGISISVGVGGHTTPYFRVAQQWATQKIGLSYLNLSSTDLSNVHILFTVETSDIHAASGATVLIDNIRFIPVPTSQKKRPGALSFPLSTKTFGVAPLGMNVLGPDRVNRNVTTIYESAISLMALLKRGTPEDLINARLIANTLDYALFHDNHGDPLPVSPSRTSGCYGGKRAGQCGLHNGYSSGDISLFNDQASPAQGKAGDIRLAGFTCSNMSSTGYCVVLDGATGGDNAFAVMALLEAYGQFNDSRYLNDARAIAHWIFANLRDKTGTGYGGYFLGYPDEGITPKNIIESKSVENNADIFAAFLKLAATEKQLGNSTAATSWTSRANIAGDFVMKMYDSSKGRFYAGTVPTNTSPAPGICPYGPQKGADTINTGDFFDSNSFPVLAMAKSARYQGKIDWTHPVEYACNTFAQKVTAGSGAFCGFDIVTSPASGPNGIAWEFTGQAVLLANFMNIPCTVSCSGEPPHSYFDEIAYAQTSAPFADGLGIVAATLQDGTLLLPADQCLGTPFQCIPSRSGLAASAWVIFSVKNLNVLAPPQ